jgi:hypothetical protein
MDNRSGSPRQQPDYPTAAELARALGGTRMGGNRFLARCPCHSDSTASLSITDGRNGRPVLHDFGGCDWQDVVRELEARGLWPRFEPSRPSSHGYKRGQRRRGR